MGNLKLSNQKDVRNVVHANVIVLLWQSFCKNARVVVVYGMRVLALKIHKAIAVVAKINGGYAQSSAPLVTIIDMLFALLSLACPADARSLMLPAFSINL